MHAWLCPPISFYLLSPQSVGQRGQRGMRCSKVCAMSVLTLPSFTASSALDGILSASAESWIEAFPQGYFTFFEQRAVLTLLVQPWLSVSGRAFVDLVRSNNFHTCSGFKLGCLSRRGIYTQTHCLLTCGFCSCAAEIALTPGVLIRPGCGLYLTGALDSNNWCLTSSVHVRRVDTHTV